MTSVLVPRKPSHPRQTRGVSFVGMDQAFVRSGRPRRRGNPNWGSGQPPRPAFAASTEFEIQVRQLGLTKQTCADSTELRRWCERNRNRCYVPEWQLAVWEIQVDPSF
jgi:hypothetical protein